MKASGQRIYRMAFRGSSSPMLVNILATIKMERCMEKENAFTLMAMCMRELLRKVRGMDKVNTLSLMGISTKVAGKTMSSTAKEN